MTLVAVAKRETERGVYGPGYRPEYCVKSDCQGPHTFDWREPAGSPENGHSITATHRVMELEEALSTNFRPHDAMAVSFLVRDRDGAWLDAFPRLTKSGLAWVQEQGFEVFLGSCWADIDNPGHGPWTADLWCDFEGHWATAKALRTVIMYPGQHGYRAVQPWSEPVPVKHADAVISAWLHELELDGIRPDRACKDWTRHFRLPGAWNKGRRYATADVRFNRCESIAPPIARPQRTSPAGRPRRPRAASSGTAISSPIFVETLPEFWTPARIEPIARALRAEKGAWHELFLALAGALCGRGVTPSELPSVVEAVSHATGTDTRTEDRASAARTTAIRVAAGEPVAGYAALLRDWPAVAEALDVVTSAGAELRVLRQLAAPAQKHVTLQEALSILEREIASPYGVTLLAGPPGLGKTRAVIEQARRLPVIQDRAAPGARIALSVPRHDLAAQVAAQLPGRTLRLFGPLSHKTHGQPTCIHYEAAAPLAAGGQSVEREFCTGRGKPGAACEKAPNCPAREGSEGELSATLALGPHALGGALSEIAGTAGALFIDELPPLVQTHRLSVEALETALRYFDVFTPAYESAMRPALMSLLAWASELGVVSETSISLAAAMRVGVASVPLDVIAQAGIDPETPAADLPDMVLVRAAEAIGPDARSKSPPVQWVQIVMARRNPAKASEIGAASSVLNILWHAITAKNAPLPVVRIEDDEGERGVVLTRLNDDLLAVLRRQGPVVGLDANAHLHMDAYGKALGFRPKLVQIAVADSAPVSRTILVTANANRRRWLPRGIPAWDEGLLSALRALVAWANESPRAKTLAIIAPSPVEAAILATLRPNDPKVAAQCKNLKLTGKALEKSRAVLGPVLATFAGAIVTGHFGAITGMDHMADCDALATVMDPRPNLGEVFDHSAFLGLDPEARMDAMAAVELEQAHGRLRLIHRTRYAKALHIGGVAPNGWQGLPVDLRRLPQGRPRNEAAMTAEEFKGARSALGMSLREFARALKMSDRAVRNYEGGERAIPSVVACAVRALVPSADETPIQISSKGVSSALGHSRAVTLHPQTLTDGCPLAMGVSSALFAMGVSSAPTVHETRQAS